MVIGRAASGVALAQPRATGNGPEFPLFFWGVSRFFEIWLHVPLSCSDRAPFSAFLRSDVSSIWDRTMKQWSPISKWGDVRSQKRWRKVEKGEKRGEKGLPIIRRNSGLTHAARGSSGAIAPPLAARPVIRSQTGSLRDEIRQMLTVGQVLTVSRSAAVEHQQMLCTSTVLVGWHVFSG